MFREKPSAAPSADGETPQLSAIVVHWRGEEEVRELVAAWPRDPRFELLVVDNSSSLGPLEAPARRLVVPRNLGFAGGANRGIAEARAPWILLLNPDARPLPGALEALLEAARDLPDAAGLVPALEGADGRGQHAWQLRPLPGPGALLLQTLLLPGVRGPRRPPPPGAPIAQPAAAALALRRSALAAVGGLDAGFYPAWFEDVDLACRLARGGHVLRYAPAARFVHGLGASVAELGYGAFLWVYYRNLERYLRRHHGAGWALAARAGLALGMLLRLALLPLRRPRRAASRRQAARGLLATLAGALTGWRRPAAFARRFSSPETSGEAAS